MKALLDPVVLIVIGIVLFCLALVDAVVQEAYNFSELSIYGKIPCIGILLILTYLVITNWFIPLVKWIINSIQQK